MKSIFWAVILSSMLLLFLGTVSVADAMGKGNNNNNNMCSDHGKWVKCESNGGGGTTPVPEPSTFILFGSLLIGAFGVKKVITG
ncbi:MAG: hypothetical protein IEMM0007_1140 [bacterium]|nr:MAG: hypothetical protein IEMM0007_1140 [bacterium]